MKRSYLEVTFRKGRPLAAYLYLPRKNDDTSARTEQADAFIVDYAADGRPIGIEIPSPSELTLDQINALLIRLGQEPMDKRDLAPLLAA